MEAPPTVGQIIKEVQDNLREDVSVSTLYGVASMHVRGSFAKCQDKLQQRIAAIRDTVSSFKGSPSVVSSTDKNFSWKLARKMQERSKLDNILNVVRSSVSQVKDEVQVDLLTDIGDGKWCSPALLSLSATSVGYTSNKDKNVVYLSTPKLLIQITYLQDDVDVEISLTIQDEEPRQQEDAPDAPSSTADINPSDMIIVKLVPEARDLKECLMSSRAGDELSSKLSAVLIRADLACQIARAHKDAVVNGQPGVGMMHDQEAKLDELVSRLPLSSPSLSHVSHKLGAYGLEITLARMSCEIPLEIARGSSSSSLSAHHMCSTNGNSAENPVLSIEVVARAPSPSSSCLRKFCGRVKVAFRRITKADTSQFLVKFDPPLPFPEPVAKALCSGAGALPPSEAFTHDEAAGRALLYLCSWCASNSLQDVLANDGASKLVLPSEENTLNQGNTDPSPGQATSKQTSLTSDNTPSNLMSIPLVPLESLVTVCTTAEHGRTVSKQLYCLEYPSMAAAFASTASSGGSIPSSMGQQQLNMSVGDVVANSTVLHNITVDVTNDTDASIRMLSQVLSTVRAQYIFNALLRSCVGETRAHYGNAIARDITDDETALFYVKVRVQEPFKLVCDVEGEDIQLTLEVMVDSNSGTVVARLANDLEEGKRGFSRGACMSDNEIGALLERGFCVPKAVHEVVTGALASIEPGAANKRVRTS